MSRKNSSLLLSLGLLLAAGLAQPQMKKAAKMPAATAPQPQPSTPVYQPPAAPAGPMVESGTKSYPTQCPPADQRISIAAYPIKPAGAPAELATAMTALLSSQLTPSPKLKVIEEAMLKTVLERQGLNASDACDDSSCQVEIGKLVKAQKLITGDLSKFGSKYILSLKLIDIQTGAMEFATEDKCSCPEDQLDLLVSTAAAEVRNHFCEAVSISSQPQPAATPVNAPALPGVVALRPQNVPEIPGPSSPNRAILYFYRPFNWNDPIMALTMEFDGRSIGQIKHHQCKKFEMDTGEHVLKLGFTTMLMTMTVQASAGDKYLAQSSFTLKGAKKGGSFAIEPVPAGEAEKWINSCELIGGH